MICKRTTIALAALIVVLASSLAAQVAPSAESGGWPIVAGVGVSGFNMDWGHDQFGRTRYMEGITGWLDWNLTRLPGPSVFKGLGVELEGRDINFGLPASLSNARVGDMGTNLRHDTGLGGVIYTWRGYRKIHPYAKALAGVGSIDFPPLSASPAWYRHDTRTITAFGGGTDFRAWRHVWVRADFEYQLWPDLFGSPNALTPFGVTIGAVYDFKGTHHR
jgi:hypothetical protein